MSSRTESCQWVVATCLVKLKNYISHICYTSYNLLDFNFRYLYVSTRQDRNIV